LCVYQPFQTLTILSLGDRINKRKILKPDPLIEKENNIELNILFVVVLFLVFFFSTKFSQTQNYWEKINSKQTFTPIVYSSSVTFLLFQRNQINNIVIYLTKKYTFIYYLHKHEITNIGK